MTAAPDGRPLRSGGRILVDNLRIHGVDAMFCVPGESYLDVLDALYDTPEIAVVVAKHEGAAANMAEADGKLTGRPGICFVTRGPGATHASIGVHTAKHDSTPMILFVGQVDRRVRGREGFQEVEIQEIFGSLAKWAAEVPDAARIPEYLARAFQIATSGRPGPVVLALPEDVLAERVDVGDALPFRTAQSAPTESDLEAMRRELDAAKRPLVIVGGSGWTDEARTAVMRFAEAHDLPVAVSFRRQDLFDNDNDQYVGHLSLGMDPRLAQAVRDADLIVAIGTRLGDVTTSGYKLLDSPRPKQRLVHVHPDPDELGRVYRPSVPIAADVQSFASALGDVDGSGSRWHAWRSDLRRNFLAFRGTLPPAGGSGVDLGGVIAHLTDVLPADAIISNGAGNYTVWVHRFCHFRELRTQLAPTSGSMGYGFPAAIAAKRRHPTRTVVCFAGDGCFLMYPQELATAVQYGIAVIVLIVNNGMYGTIRMHQERRFPGRAIGTDLRTPDFVALAASFGAHTERVTRTEDFAVAFARAQAAGVPAVIDLQVDPAQITPTARLAPATAEAPPREAEPLPASVPGGKGRS